MRSFRYYLVLLMLIVFGLTACAEGAVSLRNLKRDGRDVLEIQNALIRVRIVPELGGRVIMLEDRKLGYSFFYDPNMLAIPAPEAGYQQYGGYEEMMGPETVPQVPGVCEAESRFGGPLCRSRYSCEIVSETSQEVVIGLTGRQDYMQVVRTMTVKDGDPTLYIEATISNVSDRNRYFALWLHPSVHAGSDAGPEDISTLEVDGKFVKTRIMAKPGPSFYRPSGAYWLAVDGKLGGAVALQFSPEKLEWLKLFNDGSNYSLEFCTKARIFAPGESEQHQFAYRMLRGMTDIDWMKGSDLVQLDVSAEKCKDGRLVLTTRRWTLDRADDLAAQVIVRQNGRQIGEKKLSLAPGVSGSATYLSFAVPRGQKTVCDIECILVGPDGSELGRFSKTCDQLDKYAGLNRLRDQASANRRTLSSIPNAKRRAVKDKERFVAIESLQGVLWKNAVRPGISADEQISEWQSLLLRQEQLRKLLK